MILDVVCRYLSLFLLYINIKIGKKWCLLIDKPVAACEWDGSSLGYRWWCLWWRLFVFVLSFFPLDVLDKIWDVIKEFLTYSLYPGIGMYLHFDLKYPFIIVLSYPNTR